MRKTRWLLIVMLLSGCTLMPKYNRPVAVVPKTFPYMDSQTGVSDKSVADIGWREFFKDERLGRLIEIALKNNRDLRIAALNVQEIQARYRIIRKGLLPSFSASADGLKERSVSSSGARSETSSYNASVNTSYEVDLFGRIRSLKEQFLQQYFATEEAHRSVQIALVAEVAIQYLNERALDEQLAQLKQTLVSVESYYDLINKSFELGNSTELDLRTAEAQLESARATVVQFERQRAEAHDALTFLIGQSLPEDLPEPQPLLKQDFLAELPPGLPSELLERRPDILEAEHQLKAANANIGAVRAAFFPKITLTGSAGTASVQLSDLFAGGSEAWSFAPQITIPLFGREADRANLDAANIGKNIQIAQYERTIQNAFREVSDTLIARKTFNEEISYRRRLVEAQQKRYDLAGERYRNGIDNYLSVLTAQQDLYFAQQSLIQAEFLRLANLVNFYKALGGGWNEKTLTVGLKKENEH